jgi:hypothetical protein
VAAHNFTVAHVLEWLPSAEKSALEICVRVLEEETEGALPTVSVPDVDRAARAVFVFVQEALIWLREHGCDAGHERSLIDLWKVQALAFDAAAARCPGARQRAKALQIEAGRGQPLTVCVGDLTPKRLPDLRDWLDPAGELEEYKIPTIDWNNRGSGCLSICPDSTGMRRPSLAKWCAECRNASTARLAAQLTSIAKAFAGSPSFMTWVDGRRVRVWPRTCTVCGAPFKTSRANQRRCDECRIGHRSVRRNGGSTPRST